jgi:hypothetical protein
MGPLPSYGGQAESGRYKGKNVIQENGRGLPVENGGRERLEDSPRARYIVPLRWNQGGEAGLGDGFLLEEDLEAFAHAFGIDERFEM